MYAVIRAGGKQYRVVPGDTIEIERTPNSDGSVEFNDVLAVSAEEGQISQPKGAKVVGTVVEEGRGDKILVFHFKRKKQYKKLQGHRQPFTRVRIAEISFDGQTFTAPQQPAKAKKAKKEAAAEAKTGPRAMKKGQATAAAEKEAKPARKTASRKKA
ncbi:MAG TPA: 50S ribosomal protein L21 [Hyphomicrobiales bacterium]|nr:50S ribosomal protein L21 [Hyphomicrobiales bacterium]